jgi:hypothetical protein
MRRVVLPLVAVFILSFLVGGALYLTAPTQPTPPPTPTTSADIEYQKALAKYKAIPSAACPASLDPNLRRYYMREGQCPQGDRKR